VTSPRVGEPAPDFTLTDTAGRSVSLSEFAGKQLVHLVFNRGFF
jgi:peroxiredoxin